MVRRMLKRATERTDWRAVTATTAVIRTRLTVYWAEAATPTRARTPLGPVCPEIGATSAPAAVAARASTETL